MRQCMFMKVQLHLSHTVVECENKFLNMAWQLQTTIRRRLLGQKRVTLLSGHPNGDTQLLNLGTVSFAHIKAARNNPKIKTTFLLKYPVCAINRTNRIFQMVCDFGILCENAVIAFNPVVAKVG